MSNGSGSTQQIKDPCETKKSIHESDIRLAVYKYDPNIEKPLCDKYGIARGGEWFRIEKGREMVTNETEMFTCGTDTGLWMKGDVPKFGDGEVARKACVPGNVDACEKTYNIKVKNCKSHFVYFLVPPTNCPEAYCFGYGVPGTITKEKTEKPRVEHDLQKIIGRRGAYQELRFKCSFTPKRNSVLLYKIFWYINNSTNPFSTSKIVRKEDLNLAYLTVENGLNTITLGIQLACRVRLYLNPNGAPGPFSPMSDYFFAGLQAEQTSYYVSHDNTTDIKFRLTVPFGCPFIKTQDLNPSNCTMEIIMDVPPVSKCTGQAIAGLLKCGKTVYSYNWNSSQTLTVRHHGSTDYNLIKDFQIHLKAQQPGGSGKYWQNTRLTGLHVNIHVLDSPNQQWKGSACYAVSDPHMKAFDRSMTFENQNSGTFTLYQYKDDYGNTMEIQSKVTSCNGSPDIYCTCGIAIRSAADVFMIDRCPDRKPWYFGFPSCVENTLKVTKRKGNEWTYWIHFVTGTYVEARLQHRFNAYTIELHVFPSRKDVNRSEGLCSRLGSNTLREKGTGKNLEGDPKAFALSWSVEKANDLFLMNYQQIRNFDPMKQHKKLCICDPNITKVNELIEESLCTNVDTINCEPSIKSVQQDICFEKHQRRRRSPFSHIPMNIVHINERKQKRSVPKFTPMTKEEAFKWCTDYMNQSMAFKACTKVPSVDPNDAIRTCALDIMLTNTTDWASASREGLKSACFKELRQNQTLQTAERGKSQSIAEQIKTISCPNECSGNGVCNNGNCICRNNYGAGDCSINFNDPPHVFGANLDTGGLCDKPVCKIASLEGDPFLDRPELTCRMEEFEINYKGENKSLGVHIVPAVHNTVADIRCPFPHLRQKRSSPTNNEFVVAYKIAVSNDGKSFSDNHLLYILDSTCQDTLNVSGQLRFTLRAGYCFIRGRCVRDSVFSGRDNCKICDANVDQFGWTTLKSKPGCTITSDQPQKTSYSWIAGVVIGCIALLTTIIIALACWMKKYRYVKDSFPELKPPKYQESQKMSYKH
ncbi:von Willebrand factor D and EGF domain-containing protein-like [Saccostrea cucullata]|uniref:von Willebrand factor D and EGF domain-containing protein-like n=1 Tax=Saccostrea cuccullata TaxID=36930 RepID=UPI002ED52769